MKRTASAWRPGASPSGTDVGPSDPPGTFIRTTASPSSDTDIVGSPPQGRPRAITVNRAATGASTVALSVAGARRSATRPPPAPASRTERARPRRDTPAIASASTRVGAAAPVAGGCDGGGLVVTVPATSPPSGAYVASSASGEAGIVMSCRRAPPSDQPLKR